MSKLPNFEIICGTYEEFLVGYYFSSKEGTLVQSFATHDHTASIRCVTVSGQYVASGGADDRIFIYDLKTRKHHCSLVHHNATVNCLQFTDNHSHLMTGSADGVLAITRVGNWQLEKIWEKAHKGSAILDIAIHSSGKLALTLGADRTLCTWNLVKGRQAYVINLNSKSKDAKSLEKVIWNPDGVKFILCGGKYTEMWSIETGGALEQIEHEERVTSCAWLSETTFVAGHDNGELTIVDTTDTNKKHIKAHDSRVKSITSYKKWIITVSSNGDVKVWKKTFEEIVSINAGCRLTCLCIIPPITVKSENDAEEQVIELKEDEIPEKPMTAKVVEIKESSESEAEEPPKKKQKQKTIHKKKKLKKSNKSV